MLVAPSKHPLPIWWPLAMRHAMHTMKLVDAGDRNAILSPSKKGFVQRDEGEQFELWLFRFCDGKPRG